MKATREQLVELLDSEIVDTIVNAEGVVVEIDYEPVVEIPSQQLEDGGWILEVDADDHCGHDASDFDVECECEHADTDQVVDAVEQWHNREHAGAFAFCYSQPCRDVREAVDL